MTLDEFRQLAETWGGHIDRWPAAIRDAAREISAGGEAADILDAQRRLDDLLAMAPDVSEQRAGVVGFAVVQRIAATDRIRSRRRGFFKLPSLLPASSLVCSALLGVWFAGVMPYRHQAPDAWSLVNMMFQGATISLEGLQ